MALLPIGKFIAMLISHSLVLACFVSKLALFILLDIVFFRHFRSFFEAKTRVKLKLFTQKETKNSFRRLEYLSDIAMAVETVEKRSDTVNVKRVASDPVVPSVWKAKDFSIAAEQRNFPGSEACEFDPLLNIKKVDAQKSQVITIYSNILLVIFF